VGDYLVFQLMPNFLSGGSVKRCVLQVCQLSFEILNST
jgi:hypothetical protein